MFVNGELSLGEISALEGHLEQCGHCLKLVGQLADGVAADVRVNASFEAPSSSSFAHLLRALVLPGEEFEDRAPERESFGDYRVTGVLGRGAMGIVYRAVHEKTRQTVAIKTVATRSPKTLSAMRQEIASLRRLRHPGVVALVDSGVVDGDPWCALELLQGATLEGFLRSLWITKPARPTLGASEADGWTDDVPTPAAGGRLKEILRLFLGICTPLAFVHQAGVVHCDLKPANIFIREQGAPVLMDFGLLSRAGGSVGRESLEVGGLLRGTIPYLSPELILGQIPDARADLYSLGCILYEAVTGKPPFVASTANAYFRAHLHASPRSPTEVVANVPGPLNHLILSLLAKQPAQRIGNAGIVADELSALLEVPSHAPSSSRPSEPYLFRPRLVGRKEVIDGLSKLQTSALGGRGQIALIGGESGVGKTFLASEVAQSSLRQGFDVLAGECTPISAQDGDKDRAAGTALEPFRALLQAAGDRCRSRGPGAALQLFGSERAIALLARYEPGLAHLESFDEANAVTALPSTAERTRVLQALADLIERMAGEQPLCLILDDLQWADDLSLAFLQLAAQTDLSEQRLLILAFYRTDEVTAAIADLKLSPAVHSVALPRLDVSALRIMIDDLLSDHPTEEFVATLAAHSEGNPFFVAEYLRTAAAEGVLERTNAGWRLAASGGQRYEQLLLPRPLQALLERRLSLLADGTQQAAEAAAVLGREFRRSMLPGVVGASTDSTLAVDEMLSSQILEQTSEGQLRFAHDKLREAAYSRIDGARRVVLHGAAARVIEDTFRSTPEFPDHYAELAHHLKHAGETVRALDYFEKAGEHALRSSANADAVRFYRAACELSASPGAAVAEARRALWEHGIGDALLGVGELDASVAHLRVSVAALRYPMPISPMGLNARIACAAFRQAIHRVVPARWLRRGEPARNLREAARTYERLVQAYYYAGDYPNLFLANVMTLNLAELQAPTPTLAAAYTNAGITASIIPAHGLAATYFGLAESTLAQAYDAEVESYLDLVRSVYDAGLGKWSSAFESNLRSISRTEQLGFRRRWEEGAGVRAWLHTRLAADEGLEWASRLFESAQRRGDRQMMSWGLFGGAFLHVRRGDLSRVRSVLEEHRRLIPEPSGPELIQSIGLHIQCAIASGELDHAVAEAQRAAALVRKTGPIHLHCADAYGAIVEAHLVQCRRASGPAARSSDALASAALAMLGRAAKIFPAIRAREMLLRGIYRHARGDDRAFDIWRQSAACARQLQSPYDEACALFALGVYLPGGSIEAKQALSEAQPILSRLRVNAESLPCFARA
jgi:serine/threonine protein kinase